MATIRDQIEFEIIAIEARAKADVDLLRAKLANLPEEVAGLEASFWAHIKSFFGGPTPVAPAPVVDVAAPAAPAPVEAIVGPN